MQNNQSELCDKLFLFTAQDEKRMKSAMKQAVIFMEHYGRGRTKSRMVYLRHYARAPKADGGACENANDR